MTAGDKNIPWLRLRGKIAEQVFAAPKIGYYPELRSDGPEAEAKVVGYLERNTLDKPWRDELALAALVLTKQRLDAQTVITCIQTLNSKFSKIFQALGLKTMAQWDPDVHIPAYVWGEVAPEDSSLGRGYFLNIYTSTAKHEKRWVDSLPAADQSCYRQLALPVPNPLLTERAINWKEILKEQRQQRKAETNAIVPHYAEIRAEAHFRFSKMARLRQAYRDAVEEVKSGAHKLPFSFFYDEGGDPEKGIPAQERLHFRLWDASSLVLAHPESYSRNTVLRAQKRSKHFGKPIFFLEFVRAERLAGDAPPESLWFEEMLRRGVLRNRSRYESDSEIAERLEWLRSWGYGIDSSRADPFRSENAGVLSWPISDAKFLARVRRLVAGVFVPVEPLYAGCLFGLLATDIFTTTGARMNELLQSRLDKEGFVRLETPPPAGAKDQAPRIRYALRMIPKGERTDTLANFFIGKETERIMEKVARMLAEHYGIDVDKGQTLPAVEFYPYHARSHRFGSARYLFQYNFTHLTAGTIHACMRFLLHGMVFKTSEGNPVVIKAHLLRHAFATHAVHVEKLPVDVVREILHQKNIGVTEYYSQPTETIVAEEAEALLARLATHVNVGETLLRSPEELREQYEEAEKTVGALGEVPGGNCTCGNVCPIQRACMGCPFKVPDPSKRHQTITKKRWAENMLEYCIREGLVQDAEKLKQTIRACDVELQEMNLIEAYREDEKHAARIQIVSIGPRRRD